MAIRVPCDANSKKNSRTRNRSRCKIGIDWERSCLLGGSFKSRERHLHLQAILLPVASRENTVSSNIRSSNEFSRKMNVCENLKIKHIMLPGSLAGARVSHKTKWSLKSRVVYVAKILWCWKKAEIITLKVSTEEEEEVQLKLSEDFFRFWGVVIIVISFSGREQTLSGWVKGAGSHDIVETSWTCYLNTPYHQSLKIPS